MKSCVNCAKEISVDSLFCPYCGAKQLTDEPAEETLVTVTEGAALITEAPQATNPPEGVKRFKAGARIVTLIRNCIIMAVAVFLLVGSFLPITCLNLKEHPEIFEGSVFEDADIEFRLNAFQYITLFFDSLQDVEDEDDVSYFYDEVIAISDEFEDMDAYDLENLTLREKALINRVLYILLRVDLKLDLSGPPVSLVASAIFGILNILLSVAIFVLSILNLFTAFHIVKRGKARIYAWTMALLSASPASILAAHYAGNLCIGGGMSTIAMCSVICVATVVVVSMIFRYIFSKRDTARNIVARSIALALSIVVFCLAFAPIFSVTFRSIEASSERSRSVEIVHGVEFLEELVFSEDEMNELDYLKGLTKEQKKAYFANRLLSFSSMSKNEIESEYGASVNADILVELLGAKKKANTLALFSANVVFFILTVVGVLLIMWQSLYFFATGRHAELLVFFFKIFTAAIASVAMIVAIVFVAQAAPIAKIYIASGYRIRIGVGVILMAAFSIGAIFCPTRLTKKIRKVRPVSERRTYEDLEGQF